MSTSHIRSDQRRRRSVIGTLDHIEAIVRGEAAIAVFPAVRR